MRNILGYRDFSTQKQIRETIKSSVNYRGEDVDLAELFFFFETRKQRVWFVATDRRIYLIIDDVRKDFLKVNMSYKLGLIYSDGKLNINIDPHLKTLLYGKIYFKDSKRGWLYSKKLYLTTDELREKIKSIIIRVVG